MLGFLKIFMEEQVLLMGPEFNICHELKQSALLSKLLPWFIFHVQVLIVFSVSDCILAATFVTQCSLSGWHNCTPVLNFDANRG